MGQTVASFCACKNEDIQSESTLIHEETNRKEQLVKHRSKNIMMSKAKNTTSTKDFIKTLPVSIQPITINAYARKVIACIRQGIEKKKLNASIKDNHVFSNTQNKIKKADFDNNNYKYIGMKAKGLKEGFGIQIWKDEKYTGYFHLGKANGIGLFQHSEGDKYLGWFTNDRLDGYGIYTHNNGAMYNGMWLMECQHAIGIETWRDGSVFQGEYVQGKKHGLGKYLWSDGSRYEGEWKENSLHGYGIYYFNDNRIYYGQWENNMMNGLGRFVWKDGKIYYGYYENDKKDGFGIYTWKSPKKCFIGFWRDGKQNGLGKYMDKKKSKLGYWANGKKMKWFNTTEEAFEFFEENQRKYSKFFTYSLDYFDQFQNEDDTQ